MPIYEFRCVDCDAEMEVMQSFDAPVPEICKECGGQLEKVLHPASPIFKGSGFYSTDAQKSGKVAEKSDDAPCKGCQKDCPAAGTD